MPLASGESQVDREAVGRASIRIDASQRLNPFSDLIDDGLAAFMFENIKQGLWAEILVNRGFDDVAPPTATPYRECYPDKRNDANRFPLGGKA